MREPEGYRQTLEWLTERAGGKGWVTAEDVSKILGVSRQTVARRFEIHNGCALPVLALKLVQESRP